MTVALSPSRRTARVALAYLAMIAATVVLFFAIRGVGERAASSAAALAPAVSVSTPAVAGPATTPRKVNDFLHVLLALAVVLATARLVGFAFKLFHQPPVIGEVVAGILLGPSLLGHVAPTAYVYLLPPSVAPYLSVLAQVGVVLFMFLVGLELNTSLLGSGTHASIAISHASIIVPFLLGSGLALWLYPVLSSPEVPFTVFALFMGVSISVTAFPVLARILTDRGMQRTPLGVIALTCAAVDDVTAWCLLALVVSVVHARIAGAAVTVGLAAAYIALVIFGLRPLLRRWTAGVERRGRVTQGALAVLVFIMLISAFITESIGIHAIFGAFLIGAIIPHDSLIARDLTHRLEDLVVVLLLPAFFAITGMRTQIGLLDGARDWLICGVIVVVACVGKFGGSTAAARLTGMPMREASALGILMNTRGLMELIVLNIGLDLGVLSPTLFAMLILMAILTTLMTTPVLHFILRGAPHLRGEAGPALT